MRDPASPVKRAALARPACSRIRLRWGQVRNRRRRRAQSGRRVGIITLLRGGANMVTGKPGRCFQRADAGPAGNDAINRLIGTRGYGCAGFALGGEVGGQRRVRPLPGVPDSSECGGQCDRYGDLLQ